MNDLKVEQFETNLHEAPQSPGEQLRRAREAHRWSLEEAARQLHLTPSVVHALENGDYGRIPHPAFVRGYLRSYARLLDLPEEAVLYDFDSHWGQDAGLKPAPLKPQVGIGDQRMRWMTVIIVLVIVTLPLVWWLTQGTPPEPVAEVPENAPEEVPSLADILKEPPSGEILLSGPEAPLVEPEAQVEPEPAPEVPPPPSLDTLTLRFKEDTWAEVTADGKRLLYGIVKGGTSRTFQGKGPFQVVLGKPSVEVEFNGKPLDTAPFEQKGVVRFTVGGKDGE
ncbi:MAG: DUF4115 domain-containing protein [Gammaproteobacteria bacterium]|nr:MAG: DUF4115 domain-containing protein [Gammaproteobacteria bacterium]